MHDDNHHNTRHQRDTSHSTHIVAGKPCTRRLIQSRYPERDKVESKAAEAAKPPVVAEDGVHTLDDKGSLQKMIARNPDCNLPFHDPGAADHHVPFRAGKNRSLPRCVLSSNLCLVQFVARSHPCRHCRHAADADAVDRQILFQSHFVCGVLGGLDTVGRGLGRMTKCRQELSLCRQLRGLRRSPWDSYRQCVASFVMMLVGLLEGIAVTVAVVAVCRLLEGHFECDWCPLGHDDDCNCFVAVGRLGFEGRMLREVAAVSVTGDAVLRTFRDPCPRVLP
jgi:hypothetical protein